MLKTYAPNIILSNAKEMGYGIILKEGPCRAPLPLVHLMDHEPILTVPRYLSQYGYSKLQFFTLIGYMEMVLQYVPGTWMTVPKHRHI